MSTYRDDSTERFPTNEDARTQTVSVRQLDPATSIKRLQASYDAGDEIRFFTTRDDAALISSKSRPGCWHFATESSCDCEWFRFTLRPCRHMCRASYELAIRRHAQSSNTFHQVG